MAKLNYRSFSATLYRHTDTGKKITFLGVTMDNGARRLTPGD